MNGISNGSGYTTPPATPPATPRNSYVGQAPQGMVRLGGVSRPVGLPNVIDGLALVQAVWTEKASQQGTQGNQ